MNNKHIVFIDVLKCLAIALVCIGHVVVINKSSSVYDLNIIINTFHMPLFMMISGFLSVRMIKKPIKDFIISRMNRLVIPTISYTLLSIGILYLFLDNFGNMLVSELKGSLWFLRCLLIINVIVYGTSLTKIPDWLVCLLSCLLVYACPLGGYLRINFFMLMFWFGFYLSKYFDYYQKHIKTITVLAFLVSCIIGFTGAAPKLLLSDIMNDYYILPKYFFAGVGWSLTIIGIVYYICKNTPDSRIIKYCANIGLETLGIYGIQTILLERLIYELIYKHFGGLSIDNWFGAYIVIPISGITICLICYYITQIIKRNNFFSRILLGNV